MSFVETASVCILVQSRVAAALPLRFRTGWYPAVKIAIFFSLPPYHRVGIAKMQQDIPQTASFPLNSNHAKRISLKKTLCIKLSE